MALNLPHHHSSEIEKMFVHLPEAEQFAPLAEVFKQLSDPNRVRIFWLLCHGRECVINISAAMGMSSPAVSHHLRSLKGAGLIISVREGKEVYYSAAENETTRALHRVIEHLVQIICPLG